MDLAGAGAADDGDRFAGGDVERDVVDHLVLAVRERQTTHGDGTVEVLRLGQRPVGDLGNGVEDLLEALVAGATALHDRDREAERDHRPRHAAVGEPEGEEVAAGDAAVVRAALEQRRAVPEEREDTERARCAHHRAHEPAEARQREARLEVRVVRLVEATAFALLEREAADDAHAGEVGLEHLAQLAERLLVGAGLREHRARERARDEDHERQHDEGDERELRADLHHDLQRAREREGHVDDVEDAEAEQQPDLLEVAGRAAHDLAGRHRAVERRAEAMKAMQEQRAQLVLGVAAGVEDEPAARRRARRTRRPRARG